MTAQRLVCPRERLTSTLVFSGCLSDSTSRSRLSPGSLHPDPHYLWNHSLGGRHPCLLCPLPSCPVDAPHWILFAIDLRFLLVPLATLYTPDFATVVALPFVVPSVTVSLSLSLPRRRVCPDLKPSCPVSEVGLLRSRLRLSDDPHRPRKGGHWWREGPSRPVPVGERCTSPHAPLPRPFGFHSPPEEFFGSSYLPLRRRPGTRVVSAGHVTRGSHVLAALDRAVTCLGGPPVVVSGVERLPRGSHVPRWLNGSGASAVGSALNLHPDSLRLRIGAVETLHGKTRRVYYYRFTFSFSRE